LLESERPDPPRGIGEPGLDTRTRRRRECPNNSYQKNAWPAARFGASREKDFMSRPDMGLRRMGIQLASQLPDSLEDALLVLEYAKQVIKHVHGGRN
jgi:hypothetical protein